MRADRRALLLVSSVLALAAPACSKRSAPWLERAEVTFEGEDDEALLALNAAGAKAQWLTELKAAGFVPLADGQHLPEGATGWRLSLALAVDGPSSSSARVRVDGVVELKTRADGLVHQLEVSAEQSPSAEGLEEQREAARGALARALKDAATGAALTLSLTGKSEAELVALLGSGRKREQTLALAVLAERKSPAALNPLIKQLQADDLDVARKAVGGLLQLGDRGAVPALIEASRAKDYVFQREIVFALGALGGDEAEAYLSLMAEGHDEPLMRASAKAALDEMVTRRDGGTRENK